MVLLILLFIFTIYFPINVHNFQSLAASSTDIYPADVFIN